MSKSIIARFPVIGAGLFVSTVAGASLFFVNTADAISSKDCHEQFTTAKKAGKIKDQSFKEYKTENCKSDNAAKNEVKKSYTKEIKKDKITHNTASKEAAMSSVVAGDAVFPDAIDSKFAKEKEGTARMHTCLEQYKTNKTNNKNGNLKWIQKGGGYYSECMKHMKVGSAQ